MKRIGYLMEKIAEPENLRLAFWKARRGKPYSEKVEVYRLELDKNLLKLRAQLLSGKVNVGNYHYFKIYDPKDQ